MAGQLAAAATQEPKVVIALISVVDHEYLRADWSVRTSGAPVALQSYSERSARTCEWESCAFGRSCRSYSEIPRATTVSYEHFTGQDFRALADRRRLTQEKNSVMEGWWCLRFGS